MVSTTAIETTIDLAMPKFLWSGISASGKEEVDEIDAETAMEARKILEARGWTALHQHTTEVSDFARRQVRESSNPKYAPNLTPKERLQYHEGTAPGLWRNWLKNIGQSAWAILLLAVFLLLAIFDRANPGKSFTIGLFLLLLALVAFLYPALHWWFRRTKRLFVKLQRARTWHRWDEVLQCLDKLSDSRRATKIGIGELSMARYRALALAGLGRLEEAMTVYCAASEKAKPPPWLFHTFQAGIYTAARQHDKALECQRLALEQATDKSMACLDLGMLLVRRFNCPAEARQLLAQVENAQLSELERVYVPYLRGVIAFRENDFAAMDNNIREALAGFEKRASIRFNIFEGSLLTCKGYLAVSSAALGRKDEGRRYFAESKAYLTLIELNDLVAQYQALAGTSS